MGKLSVEQGDRPPAATGPGKNRCGGPTAVGMASWGSPGRLSHGGPTALGSGARGRGERRLLPGVPGRMKMPQRYRPLQRQW